MNWLPIIMVSIQITLVAALALLASCWFRSAAHRHSVLLASLLCILASPLFYVGAAWCGISVNLPAPFQVPHAIAGSALTTTISTPDRREEEVAASPAAHREFPQTAIPDPSPPTAKAQVAPAAAIAERPKKVSRPPLREDHLLAGLWLVGTLFALAGVLRSQLKTNFILKAARPVGEGIDTCVIAETERRLGAVRHLRVATTGKVPGPAVVGIFQPWILIPIRYLETLSRDELLQVLIHEGAHVLRRDPLVALLQRISGALFWWHPMVHLVNRKLTRAREEVCDNFVLTHTEPQTYGATLLRLATLSPAMARFPLAIGMFDGRGKLEQRIQGLLDSRRKILTHVRFATAATVLGTFTLFSVAVAAARVGAQNPADAPAVAPTVSENEIEVTPAEAIDAKEFRLILTYHGESDKPFYNLILNVLPPGAQQANPFSLAQRINEGQAVKLIKHLKESQFFEHARVTETQNDPTTGPQYFLRVRLKENHYEGTLGWDVGTLARLDALRKTLNGDAAKAMDQLLARLDGQRKVWESGEVVDDLNGLRTRIPADKQSFSRKPASADFEFEVAPNPARADDDPVDRLLPLVKEGWRLGAGPGGEVKLKPGSNWGETTGRMVTFVYNPPSSSKNAGHVWLWLAEKPAFAQPVDNNSSAPATEYLGKISRWHVYFLASEIGLKAWPTTKEEIKHALAAISKVSIRIDAEPAEFVVGERVAVPITIRNVGEQDLKAPETYWSARVLLDDKEYPRRAQSPWSGAGLLPPSASYEGTVQLSEHEFGITSSALAAGQHKLALRIDNDTSNEVFFTMLAEKRKVSLKIDAKRLKFAPSEDITVMLTIGNLGATDLEAPATYWAARVILDGKEYPRHPKFIGPWNGPGMIIHNGVYRGGINFMEYSIDPATLKPGEHKFSVKLGDEKSNELTLDLPAAGPKREPKLSIKIAAAGDRVVPLSGDIDLTVTLRNLQAEKVSLQWVYGNTRVVFDGKDIGHMGFTIDRGPAELDSLQEFRTTQTLALGELSPGAHTVALQVGDDTSNNLIVDLGWSETIEGLNARLSVEAKEVVEGATKLSVHLELQNASETRETKELHLDLQNVKFAVVDGEGKAVSQPQVIDYGGRVAGPWTVRLAPGGSQRIDMTSWGLSIRPNLAAVLDLGPTFAWEFTSEQSGPYYLQARLEIAKDSKQPAAWSGRIDLPKSKLPLFFKRTR